MPGHKRKSIAGISPEFASVDFTEVEGTDDLHDPSGIILEAEKYAAEILGADETFFLINGSTSGVLAAISGCVKKGGKLLMARNSHRSALNAVYLRDIVPVFIFPDHLEEPFIPDALSAADIEKGLDENPDVEAVFIVSPTYEGRLSDIRSIAEAVHKRGIPLIVDEAHGAHLSFTKNSSSDAIRSGADVVIQSVHKTLPAPTQTALLSVKGRIADSAKIRRFLSIYQSSSPSYPLMSMIDGCVRYMAENGDELISKLQTNFEKMLNRLEVCDKLIFSPCIKDLREGRADYGKLLICTGKCRETGFETARILREEFGIETEMDSEGYVLAMFTVCDDPEDFHRVTEALIALDKRLSPNTDPKVTAGLKRATDFRPLKKMGFAESCDAPHEEVPLEEAEGRVCASLIYMYPPGTPLLIPGEEISGKLIRFLQESVENGANIKGITSSGISVVKKLV